MPINPPLRRWPLPDALPAPSLERRPQRVPQAPHRHLLHVEAVATPASEGVDAEVLAGDLLEDVVGGGLVGGVSGGRVNHTLAVGLTNDPKCPTLIGLETRPMPHGGPKARHYHWEVPKS